MLNTGSLDKELTCSQEKDADMVDHRGRMELEDRVRVVDLLKVRLEQSPGDNAPEHRQTSKVAWVSRRSHRTGYLEELVTEHCRTFLNKSVKACVTSRDDCRSEPEHSEFEYN